LQRFCQACPAAREPPGGGAQDARCLRRALHLFSAAAARVLVSTLSFSGTSGHLNLASALRIRTGVTFAFFQAHFFLLLLSTSLSCISLEVHAIERTSVVIVIAS